MNKQRKKPWLFRAIRYVISVLYPRMEVVGLDKLSDEPCIIVGNHAQLHGPIACELYLAEDCFIWCAAPMMKLKEVPAYAYKDFWSQKPKALRPFFKVLSYIIAPLSVLIFNNARTVAVYRDNRVLSTFKESVSKLKDGKRIVIFPEHDKAHNRILCDFQEGFVDLAALYYRRTGKELAFVPLYIAPDLKKMYLGDPIPFSGETPIAQERRRICDGMMKAITDMAEGLPEHTVIPYLNIPKRLYPKNRKTEDEHVEKAVR